MNQFIEEKLQLPHDRVFQIEGFEYVNLSTPDKIRDPGFLASLRSNVKSDRINIFSSQIEEIRQTLTEPYEDTYSWYIHARKGQTQIRQEHQSENYLKLKTMDFSELSTIVKAQLTEFWKSQYVDSFQIGRPKVQLEYLQESINNTLNEGTHLLFYNGDQLVGHGSHVPDFNEVLKLENSFVHLWANQNVNSDIRRSVLTQYFHHLSNLGTTLTAGIAVNNFKSLAAFEKSEFKPIYLAIGFFS